MQETTERADRPADLSTFRFPQHRDESLEQIAHALQGIRLDLTRIRELLAGGR
jgi:hypothetical protein